MMHEQIRRQVVQEKKLLEAYALRLEADDRLERMAVEMRLRSLEKKIVHFSTPREAVVRAQTVVTFRGAPVVGNSAIYADFAGKALSSFQELLSSFMSSLVRREKKIDKNFPKTFEPLPLAVVGVVHGSFGFELKEIEESSDGTMHLVGNTLLKEALEKALEIFRASQGRRDEFIGSAKTLDARSINALAEFLEEVHSSRATFQITTDEESDLVFDEVAVKRAFSNASEAVQQASSEAYFGVLSGVFINSRKFEFIAENGKALIGKIHESVDPHSLTPHLEQRCEVTLSAERSVRAGKRKPRDRFTLIAIRSAEL